MAGQRSTRQRTGNDATTTGEQQTGRAHLFSSVTFNPQEMSKKNQLSKSDLDVVMKQSLLHLSFRLALSMKPATKKALTDFFNRTLYALLLPVKQASELPIIGVQRVLTAIQFGTLPLGPTPPEFPVSRTLKTWVADFIQIHGGGDDLSFEFISGVYQDPLCCEHCSWNSVSISQRIDGKPFYALPGPDCLPLIKDLKAGPMAWTLTSVLATGLPRRKVWKRLERLGFDRSILRGVYETVEKTNWFQTFGVSKWHEKKAAQPCEVGYYRILHNYRICPNFQFTGGTLKTEVRGMDWSQLRQQFGWKTMNPDSKARLLLCLHNQLVVALYVMHDTGYIHGDLKPLNILLDPEASCSCRGCNHGSVLLIDFGAVTPAQSSRVRGRTITLEYQDPRKLADFQSDNFSFALTFLEMALDSIPFPNTKEGSQRRKKMIRQSLRELKWKSIFPQAGPRALSENFEPWMPYLQDPRAVALVKLGDCSLPAIRRLIPPYFRHKSSRTETTANRVESFLASFQ